MAVSGQWFMREFDVVPSTGGAALYKVIAACFDFTERESERFKNYWDTVLSKTCTGTCARVAVTDANGAGIDLWVTCVVDTDADPEDCHEDVIDDIKTTQDALTARDTQVTQAITDTTGEIETYAAGKIVAIVEV